MTDETESSANGEETAGIERTTAPMSEFTARETLIGAVVALTGIAIAFGIPLLAVGV